MGSLPAWPSSESAPDQQTTRRSLGRATHAVLRHGSMARSLLSRVSADLLFGEQPTLERTASIEAIGEFFLDRLRSIFAGVSRKALTLRNTTGTPIYLLCFAAANKKGAQTAIKIADHILKA